MPAHEVTEKNVAAVEALASFGTPEDEIAAYLGISLNTFRKYYLEIERTAKLNVKRQVFSFLSRAATGKALKDDEGATFRDCLTAAMFISKTKYGFRETDSKEKGAADRIAQAITEAINSAPQ